MTAINDATGTAGIILYSSIATFLRGDSVFGKLNGSPLSMLLSNNFSCAFILDSSLCLGGTEWGVTYPFLAVFDVWQIIVVLHNISKLVM